MWWLEYLVDMTLGFAHQAIARVFPFRVQTDRPEITWDVIGIVASGVFATAFYFCIEPVVELAHQTGALGQWQTLVATWPIVWVLAGNLLATDFLVYWTHRLLHTRWLWHAHAWHHSPRCVYWASGLRGSPLHIALTLAPASVAYLLFPLAGYGTVVLGYTAFHLINQHYLHSNIWVPYACSLEHLLVTPRFHFVHHSRTQVRTNSNYGFVFSVWDRWFGTYVDPECVPADDPLGLDYPVSNPRLLLGLPPGRRASRSLERPVT